MSEKWEKFSLEEIDLLGDAMRQAMRAQIVKIHHATDPDTDPFVASERIQDHHGVFKTLQTLGKEIEETRRAIIAKRKEERNNA